MVTAVLAATAACSPLLMLSIGLVAFVLLDDATRLLLLAAVVRSLLFFGLVSGGRPRTGPIRFNRAHRPALASTHMFVRVPTRLFVHFLFPRLFPWRSQIKTQILNLKINSNMQMSITCFGYDSLICCSCTCWSGWRSWTANSRLCSICCGPSHCRVFCLLRRVVYANTH